MFRKARQDAEKDQKAENEQNYQKRVTQLESKPKPEPEKKADDGDWLSNLKTHTAND